MIDLAKARNEERKARADAVEALRGAELSVLGLSSSTIKAASDSAARLRAFAEAIRSATETFKGGAS